jgi:hypothetical protein
LEEEMGEITPFSSPISEIILVIRDFAPERLLIAFGLPVALSEALNLTGWRDQPGEVGRGGKYGAAG